MPSLPDSEIFLLVRTYFGLEDLWAELRQVVETGSEEGFLATVAFVDDRQFEGLSVEELEAAHPHRSEGRDVIYVADERAVSESAHPLLVVRVGNTEDAPFRCRADALYEVDANLTLANLDWNDFRGQIDQSGVYGAETAARPAVDRGTDPTVLAYQSASNEQHPLSMPPVALWEICEDLSEVAESTVSQDSQQVNVIAGEILRRIDEASAPARPQDRVTVTLSAAQWVFIRDRAARRQSRYGDLNPERRRAVGKVIAAIGLEGL